MIRTLHVYDFEGTQPLWAELREQFPRNTSKFGGPCFVAGSEQEKRFQEYCRDHGLSPCPQTILEYRGPEPRDAGLFLYLCLKGDKNGKCVSEEKPSFIDYSEACPAGGAFAVCDRGAKQAEPALIRREGLSIVTELGFIHTQYPFRPALFLISPAVRGLLVDLRVTGCEIVPCKVDPPVNTDASPECYQLIITSHTIGPAQVGDVRVTRQCPNCGAVGAFAHGSERSFRASDLSPVDFQMCDLYEASSVGRFHIMSPFPIISQRVFDVLLRNKIKGLFRYATDPPIKHVVVQVRS